MERKNLLLSTKTVINFEYMLDKSLEEILYRKDN